MAVTYAGACSVASDLNSNAILRAPLTAAELSRAYSLNCAPIPALAIVCCPSSVRLSDLSSPVAATPQVQERTRPMSIVGISGNCSQAGWRRYTSNSTGEDRNRQNRTMVAMGCRVTADPNIYCCNPEAFGRSVAPSAVGTPIPADNRNVLEKVADWTGGMINNVFTAGTGNKDGVQQQQYQQQDKQQSGSGMINNTFIPGTGTKDDVQNAVNAGINQAGVEELVDPGVDTPQPNYIPWIIGGVAVLGLGGILIYALTRNKD